MVNEISVVFRVDASLAIGSGHVMRCLTLAHEIRTKGGSCTFICREHTGHLIDAISGAGFACENLDMPSGNGDSNSLLSDHSYWLGVTQESDARDCIPILDRVQPDWLVVDHYGLDHEWENLVANHVGKIMVIDDLANREHQCELLLDQNLGRKAADYKNLVPLTCTVLVGPMHALLGAEFSRLRNKSLLCRETAGLDSIVVAMGGVDAPDATGKVLEALKRCALAPHTRITVIMGLHAPALESIRHTAATMPYATQVLVNIDNVGEVMAASDLAIGAVGGSAWERCVLGLPSILVVLAENQKRGAIALAAKGAGVFLGEVADINLRLPVLIGALDNCKLRDFSRAAAMLTDGSGAFRVARHMSLPSTNDRNELGSVRTMCRTDLRDVWAWRNHWEVRRYMRTQHEISWEEHLAWFASASIDPTRHLLIYEGQQQARGFVSFTESGDGGSADWGFYLAPGSPKGTGRKLARSALDFAFERMKMHKVCGQALGFNERSIRFHLNLGFVQEGIMRDQYFNGAVHHDVFNFGLLSYEWYSVREKCI